ncbi:stage II sporulation protein D [Salipaludibacillus neizhouensis]|nr:stage II sporulation protein D [Salipaludibacillus neizhouensis]
MKGFLMVGVIFAFAILIVPALLVTGFSGGNALDSAPVSVRGSQATVETTKEQTGTNDKKETKPATTYELPTEAQTVSVFRSTTEMIEEVPLEEYIIGVVASEMPASYEMEALKAQALTARTYYIRQILDGADLELPEGADVTDTVMHQVFKNEAELKENWGSDYDWMMSRIQKAVYDTEGQIITYEEEPITATFFSTSNGYTENSEEYWPNEIPYLRSVESPWDLESPRYKDVREISAGEFQELLQVNLPDGEVGEIVSRTTGGRVAEVKIGDKTFTGRDIRDKLELDSSDFDWSRNGDTVVIETRGWGHGVGMSQFGADGMAKAGNDYRDIIHYYYQGVSIVEAATVLAQTDFGKNS